MATIEWNPAELLKITGSYWETCALHAGVKLNLFWLPSLVLRLTWHKNFKCPSVD